jgi:hypothetical protein
MKQALSFQLPAISRHRLLKFLLSVTWAFGPPIKMQILQPVIPSASEESASPYPKADSSSLCSSE